MPAFVQLHSFPMSQLAVCMTGPAYLAEPMHNAAGYATTINGMVTYE